MEKETVLEIEFIPVWDKWAWKVKKWTLEVDEIFPRLNNVFRKYGLNFYFHLHMLEEPIGQDELISDYVKKNMEKGMKIVNEKYGKPKRWRAEYGGEYFFVTSHGKVRAAIDYKYDYDTNRYNFGNYFKTKEQAKKALGRMKEVLKEVTE